LDVPIGSAITAPLLRITSHGKRERLKRFAHLVLVQLHRRHDAGAYRQRHISSPQPVEQLRRRRDGKLLQALPLRVEQDGAVLRDHEVEDVDMGEGVRQTGDLAPGHQDEVYAVVSGTAERSQRLVIHQPVVSNRAS
jgi:hypothetical protein